MQPTDSESPLPGEVPSDGENLPNIRETFLPNDYRHNHHIPLDPVYHTTTKILNTDPAAPKDTTTNSNRTHVLRTTKKLLHRCPFGICSREHRCSGQYGRPGTHRSSGGNTTPTTTTTTTHLNIPFETTPTRVSSYDYQVPPQVSQVSGDVTVGGWSYQHHNHNIQYNHNHNEFNTRRDLLTRGVHNIFNLSSEIIQQQQQQQQPQPQPPPPVVLPHNRNRAINYMMSYLQLSSSGNEAALKAVRKRIENLEEQVYREAKSKDEYVYLVAKKLGAITQRLNTTKHNHLDSHVHPQVASV